MLCRRSLSFTEECTEYDWTEGNETLGTCSAVTFGCGGFVISQEVISDPPLPCPDSDDRMRKLILELASRAAMKLEREIICGNAGDFIKV